MVAMVYAGTAHAEGGELFLRLGMANEVARLHQPEATYQSGAGSWTYVPRFGLGALYGLTHWLAFGVGANVSLPTDVTAQDVVMQGLPAGVLTARYWALLVPISLGLHLTQGSDWSAEVVASGGPAFSHWQADDLRTASGTRLPLEPFESWYTEWFGRLAIMTEWRPTDWAAFAVGPYAGMSTARDVYVGIVIEGALIFGAGPYIRSSER